MGAAPHLHHVAGSGRRQPRVDRGVGAVRHHQDVRLGRRRGGREGRTAVVRRARDGARGQRPDDQREHPHVPFHRAAPRRRRIQSVAATSTIAVMIR